MRTDRGWWMPMFFLSGLVLLLLLFTGYFLWCRWGRTAAPGPVDLHLEYVDSFGIDTGRGNLVSIQTYMLPADYSSEQCFRAKMDGYFQRAQSLGWLQSKTVVVLPEYLGTWLVASGEKSQVYTDATFDGAMRTMAASNPAPLALAAINAPAPNKLEYGMLRMKAASMAGIYNNVMSDLARRYHVTIVAGSIVLPSPSVVDGKLTSGSGPLYNVSPVYLPDGQAAPGLTFKDFLIPQESSFLKSGDPSRLPVIDTPAGKLGVLICADSWHPQGYKTLQQKGAAIVAVPSFIPGYYAIDATWEGYGDQKPADVPATDAGRITNGQAWAKYALAGRLPGSGIPYGIMSCLRGRMWDLGSDGATVVVVKGSVHDAPNLDGAEIVNLWM